MPLCRLLASHEHGTMEMQPASRLCICLSGMSSCHLCRHMHIINMRIVGDSAHRTHPQPGFVTAAAAEAAWHSLRRRLPCPNPQHGNFEVLSLAAPVAGAKGHLADRCPMARQRMHCMSPDGMLAGCYRCVANIAGWRSAMQCPSAWHDRQAAACLGCSAARVSCGLHA